MLQMFDVIALNEFKLNISESSIAQSQTKLLGHFIRSEGIEVDPKVIPLTSKTTELRNITELRSFLGLSGY